MPALCARCGTQRRSPVPVSPYREPSVCPAGPQRPLPEKRGV